MVKEIIKDFLLRTDKAEPATTEDIEVARDLLDTLKANSYSCVGLSANMIGVNKRIIVINAGIVEVPMLNPVIVNKDIPYETQEANGIHKDKRKRIRYAIIEVEYEDMNFQKQKQTFTGWLAQLIQYEIDQCEGYLAV